MAQVTHEGFKRLLDPNYEPELTHLEGEAPSEVSLPSLEDLITSGALPPGTLLSPIIEDRDTIAEITEDGYIKVGDHLCESPDRAAREDQSDMDSGWDYWLAYLEDGPILLSEVRENASVS
jgi:hypothetical protein